MSIRLIIFVLAFLPLLLSVSPARAKCGSFPNVSWWGKLTHEGIKAYVEQKHGGDWSGYLDKWSRQLANVRAIYGQGKGIKIPSTGVVIKELQLSDYIGKLAQRVDVNECLAKESTEKAGPAKKKADKKALKVSPFGEGVNAYRARNFKVAHDIWLPLGEAGNPKAQNALGYLYRKGFGVDADLATSQKWYTMSANQGNRVGIYSLGDIARTTATSKGEMAKALILIRKSADLNYRVAQNALAELYHQGKDLPASNSEAYFWISLAIKNNFKKAQDLKALLDKSLSTAEKKALTERATLWLSEHRK